MTTSTRARTRKGAALGIAALVVLAAGGCKGISASPKPAGSGAASTPKEKILTGTRLKSLLLPASAMPNGFHIDPSNARNTGDSSVLPASSAPVPPAKVCGILVQTAWIRDGGLGSATFAQDDYGNASHTDQVAQEIDAFHGDGARQTMANLWKAFGHCKAFTDHANGMTSKHRLVRSRLTGAGDEGIKSVSTSPAYAGGITLAAVRVGNNVITVLYSSSHHDKGSAAVKMAKKIAENVRAAG